ncbi:MAG: hypothetical protein ABR549_01355 [Mycobacteriales bacterium]
MTTPLPREPREPFVEEHLSLDERLNEAFRRYDVAFNDHSDKLVEARLNLALLLWSDDDPPAEVTKQLEHDGEVLLRETPPLPEPERES